MLSKGQPALDFNRRHRQRPERDLASSGMYAIQVDTKQADGVVGLSVHGSPHVQNVVKSFQLDRAGDVQVRSRSPGEFTFEAHIHRYRVVLHRGVYPPHDAGNDSVPGVDGGDLSDLHIAGLRLRDAEHSRELLGSDYSGDQRGVIDTLADLDLHLVEHPVRAGPDHE